MIRHPAALVTAGISLGIWLGATASIAAPVDPAARVLAAARNAYGHADWDHLGVLVETGTDLASGLHGRWRLAEDLATGRMHTTTDFGVFKVAAV